MGLETGRGALMDSDNEAAHSGSSAPGVKGLLSADPHRVIYATILLITAYTIYDEGVETIRADAYLDLVGLSVAPLFALSMAHAFSDALDLQIRTKRRLTGHDRRHLFVSNLQYMTMAVPPVALITVLAALGLAANLVLDAVQVLLLLSLGGWGYFAGRKAGVRPLRRWTFAASYFLMGLVVIVVELLLTNH